MSELAEKVAEEKIIGEGTGRQDYTRDFRHLTEIDKTHVELPYNIETYYYSGSGTYSIGETKAHHLTSVETTSRYFLRAMITMWGFIGAGYEEIFRRKHEAIIVDLYFVLNAVTTPLLTRIFTWKTHRCVIWATAQPMTVMSIEPPQLVQIPEDAELWMKITNRCDTEIYNMIPHAQFLQIT